MNATVNVVCYKWKTLANGEQPLMIRVCKDGKKRYQSIGISVNPSHWDFIKNQPRKSFPNKDMVIRLIAENVKEYQTEILESAIAGKTPIPFCPYMDKAK